jgi:DNA polymerase-3 subunit delta
VKAKPLQLDALTTQIKNQYAGALVFGTDMSRIYELSHKIQQLILPNADAFSLVVLNNSQLKTTPYLATDEANTPNLMGDRRLIWIKDANNVSDDVIRHFCDNRQTDAFLLISADNLPKNNTLRVEAESNPQFIAFACYPPENNELAFFIKDFTHQNGFNITPDAMEYLIQNTSNNLTVLKSELEKIALYNQEKKQITLSIIQSLTGDGTVQVDSFIQMIANQQIHLAIPFIQKLQQQGEQPVTILRSLARYFDLLLEGKSFIQQGENVVNVVDKLLKPAQFRLKQPLQKQLMSWSYQHLIQAHHLFLDAEIQMKINTLSQILILQKCILDLNPV